MFTVKLITVTTGSEKTYQQSISCSKYTVEKSKDKDIPDAIEVFFENGSRQVFTIDSINDASLDTYQACFVENQSGKTIDKILAPNLH